jgi:cyclopropane fatty-acyl-phospholipid synthase-like methyltransferase
MSQPPTPTSYDEFPYPRNAYFQTHPDHLATIATLFGLKPVAVDQCRVLELGCCCGDNIVPLALSLPQSTFVGIDLSDRQIALGQQTISALGLKNVELRHASIMEVDESYGIFDYVICHGV